MLKIIASLVVGVGLGYGLAQFTARTSAAPVVMSSAATPAPPNDVPEAPARAADMDAALTRLELIAQSLTSRQVAPASSERSASPEVGPPSTGKHTIDEVWSELQRLSAAQASVETSLEAGVWQTRPPTLQQLQQASELNGDAVTEFLKEYRAVGKPALERLMYKSYDEVLARFGKPTSLEQNRWKYSLGTPPMDFRLIELTFSDVYVSHVEAFSN